MVTHKFSHRFVDFEHHQEHQNREGGMTDYAQAPPPTPRADLPDRPLSPPQEPGAMFPGMHGGSGDSENDAGDSNYTSSQSRNMEGAKASEVAKSKSGKVPNASSADSVIMHSTPLFVSALALLSLIKPFIRL
jgi:hypothetical protein